MNAYWITPEPSGTKVELRETATPELAFEGRLATVGHLDHVLTSTLDLEVLHRKRLTLFGVSNRLRGAAQRAETVRGFRRDLWPCFADGRVRPLVDKVFGFEALPAAIAFMEADAQVGKIVVRVRED